MGEEKKKEVAPHCLARNAFFFLGGRGCGNKGTTLVARQPAGQSSNSFFLSLVAVLVPSSCVFFSLFLSSP